MTRPPRCLGISAMCFSAMHLNPVTKRRVSSVHSRCPFCLRIDMMTKGDEKETFFVVLGVCEFLFHSQFHQHGLRQPVTGHVNQESCGPGCMVTSKRQGSRPRGLPSACPVRTAVTPHLLLAGMGWDVTVSSSWCMYPRGKGLSPHVPQLKLVLTLQYWTMDDP